VEDAAQEENKTKGLTEIEGEVDSDVDSEAESEDDLTRLANLNHETLMSEERRKMLSQEHDAQDGEEEDHDEPNERPNFKKRICKFFAMNGKCRNGDRCGFLHEVSREVRPVFS
jgi:hypothetical protein